MNAPLRSTVSPPDGPRRLLRAQDIELDTAGFLVRRNGRSLPAMPMKQFQLLQALLERAGQLVSREELALTVWGDAGFADSNTLDQHVTRLRRRIEDDPHHPTRIRTIRGTGYIFDVEPVGD